MFKITRLLNTTLVAAILSILSACGSGDQNSTLGSSGFNNDCPPEPSSSLSALDRIGGIENLEKYSKWQTKLPPLNCAGALANYIPILPDGYGLPPMSRPPIMMDGHVYLRYVEIPEAKNGEPLETLNFAFQPQYEFEIAQLTQTKQVNLEVGFETIQSHGQSTLLMAECFTQLGAAHSICQVTN